MKANCLGNVFMQRNSAGHNDFASFRICFQIFTHGALTKRVWNESSLCGKRLHFPNRSCLYSGFRGTVGTHFSGV